MELTCDGCGIIMVIGPDKIRRPYYGDRVTLWLGRGRVALNDRAWDMLGRGRVTLCLCRGRVTLYAYSFV